MTNHTETPDTTAATADVNTTDAVSFYSRHKLRLGLGVLILVVLSGAAIFTRSTALANLNEDQISRQRALVVNTNIITAVNQYQVKQKYAGSIVASRESDHGFDKAGLLAEVLVDAGDQVMKGDILARLDMRRLNARGQELEAALAQTQALNQETQALLDRAQASFDRYAVLLNKRHISEQKFDQVKFDLIALKARKKATAAAVTKSKAALTSLDIDRQLATLTARFDGSVIRRYLDEGSALSAGTSVIRLIEDRTLEIHVGLPASAALSLVPGERHTFTIHGGQITTRLRSVLRRVDQSTRTVTAIFDVTGNPGNIRAGDLAQLAITRTIRQAGFWLPSSALAESRRGLWSVYTLKADQRSPDYGTLLRQELQVIYTETDRVFVRGTLQNGDRIIANGIHRLVPGQMVRIAREN